MTEEAALLRAIQIEPHDWTPRLIYADWLEERDDPRHEFVRFGHDLTHWSRGFADIEAEDHLRRLIFGSALAPYGPFYANPIGMAFALVPPGEFVMGSRQGEIGRDDDEVAHSVRLSRGFYLGAHLVTQEQWTKVMGINPSHFRAAEPKLPVEWVTWGDAVEFCGEMGRLHGGCPYRLPTEAEWEYACRAGTSSPYFFGERIIWQLSNYESTYSFDSWPVRPPRGRTTPVDHFPPNAWGLYDMHGNVQEFTADWFEPFVAGDGGRVDPTGPATGTAKVIRGGNWGAHPSRCRSAERETVAVDSRSQYVGFRVAIDADWVAEQISGQWAVGSR